MNDFLLCLCTRVCTHAPSEGARLTTAVCQCPALCSARNALPHTLHFPLIDPPGSFMSLSSVVTFVERPSWASLPKVIPQPRHQSVSLSLFYVPHSTLRSLKLSYLRVSLLVCFLSLECNFCEGGDPVCLTQHRVPSCFSLGGGWILVLKNFFPLGPNFSCHDY